MLLGRRFLLGLLLAATATVAGCRSDPLPPVDGDFRLAPHTGTVPTGPAGSRLLGVPLVVVTDLAGELTANVPVTLAIASGPSGFSLPEMAVASGPDGVVRADVVLGETGDATIRVTTGPTQKRVETTVTVRSTTPPVVTAVAPQSFGPGDEVTLTGTGLPSAEAGAAVFVGGVQATVLSAAATQLRVRAPACVTPGPVPVTVTVNGQVTTPPVQATYVGAATASLQVLEGVTVPAERLSECLTLLGGGARYLVVPQYATRTNVSGRPSFLLGADAVGGPVTAAITALPDVATLTPQQRLDRALRLRERELSPMAAASGPNPPMDAPPLAALELNSKRNFKVLADLDGDRFETVTSRLKFIGDDILVYVDEAAPANGFTDAQLEQLGRVFDRKLYDVAVNAFGSESDIDRNGHVVVLLTPVVNKLTTAQECEQFGFVTGFFYGLDLTPSLTNSNKAEVFYSVVPDPDGVTGSCAHSMLEVNRLVPATFIHELQHMISWNQHVLVRGAPDEELWLNEGLSHMAEELASLVYERDPSQPRSTPGQLFPDSSQGFITGNVGNAYAYLDDSRSTSLTLFRDFGSLEERGAAWLFLRWLGDQKGDGIFRRLVETRETGAANVEDKAGEPFRRLFADFSTAIYASHLPNVEQSAIPERYRFTSRNFRQIFRRFYDTGFEGISRPFPILPDVIGAGGSTTGSMVPGTMTWVDLRTAPAAAGVTLRFTANGGGTFAEALGAQVTILRLPNP
jgi:hypothetical protein